ncbi:MAG: tetratricopeptide repeat protein [Terriglobia bacterium]|jgi:tetratricopeptide (TPR) repeat protein
MAFHKARALQAAEKSVAQGKILQAIKQYQDILDNDPSDVSLLNTVGDLYIRERNVTEGLRLFHKLAEAYVREGFNVKAIAIYRKISKVDPSSVETLLKLAELYQLQGLSREAREQYLQAAEFFKKRNQTERALEVLHKLVQLDPENLNFRNRLAAECEQAGKREDAALSYLESAEILLRRGDQVATEVALKKAAELDPKNARIQILRARVAIARQEPEEAERIINSAPELQADPAVMRILLDAYLGTQKLPEAENLAREVFQANPSDFAPLSSVSALLLEKGDIDQAYQLLSSVADQLINQNNARLLLDSLRRIWNRAPEHLPTLELIHRVCEQTADELTLPEVLEALGHAHEHAGDLEKAEAAYLGLVEREPENENYRGSLNAVQKKLGKEIKPEDFSTQQMALAEEEEIRTEPSGTDADQEAMVKEALENSDLFARYNLTEKAISELEKVLQVYPDQIDVHRRILEICRKGYPERGALAAAQLARIFTELGEVEMASKYQAIASPKGALHEIPLPGSPPSKEEPTAPPPPPPETPETGMPGEFPIALPAPDEPVAGTGAQSPTEAFFDLTPRTVLSEPSAAPPSPPAPAGQTMELDLTGDLEALTGLGFEAPAPSATEAAAPPPVETSASDEEPSSPPAGEEAVPPAEVPTKVSGSPLAGAKEAIPADLEDSIIEVEFYLENDFVEEARQALAALEEKHAGSPVVARLRHQLNLRSTGAPAALPPAEPAREVVQAEPEAASPPEPTLMEEDLEQEEWELPTSYAASAGPDVGIHPVVPPTGVKSEVFPPVHEPVVNDPVGRESRGADMLSNVAGELPASLGGMASPAGAHPATPTTSPIAGAPPSGGSGQGAEQLSGLLSEMEEPGAAEAAKDDPETHYNLGVAFREMGLLDEAIGEFQKVVKIGGKGNFPPNFLQACSLLAICFMEKKMPAIAGKWYIRALETPDLDEEAQLALQYDLGVAYEQAGESRKALERFTEVYSQNIDFRDVADKIRELQQKA